MTKSSTDHRPIAPGSGPPGPEPEGCDNHCSLRFSPPFFATQRGVVAAAGCEAGEGFIKLPYGRELPIDLLKTLMKARVEDDEAMSAGQDDR